MMTPDEEREWLASLKVGDEVAFDKRKFSGQPEWVITKIVKITPKRLMDTENGIRWRNGKYRVDSWFTYHLVPVTAEVRLKVKDAMTIRELENTFWSVVSPNKRDRIYAILKE